MPLNFFTFLLTIWCPGKLSIKCEDGMKTLFRHFKNHVYLLHLMHHIILRDINTSVK